MSIQFTRTGTNTFDARKPGGVSVQVERTPDGWVGRFYGSARRNPVVYDEVRRVSVQSAMCPLVQLDGTFASDVLAAEAAIEAREADFAPRPWPRR